MIEVKTDMGILNLDPELIKRCNSVSQFDAGDVIARDAEATYRQFEKAFGNRAGLTPKQCAYLDGRAASWKELIEAATADHLRRRAAYVPWNVAGPSRYDSKRMDKRVDAIERGKAEWSEKLSRFIENTQKGLESLTPLETVLDNIRKGKWKHGEAIATDDPYVIEKLTAKAEYHRMKQERMKSANTYYRKHHTMRGFEGVSDDDSAVLDSDIAESFYGIPYAPFSLRNNNAMLREIEARIKRLQAHFEKEPLVGYDFEGGHVEANYELDRLQIFFDEKPDEEMREKLKSHGFHYSRRNNHAWQRQLTANAIHAARRVLEDLHPGEESA